MHKPATKHRPTNTDYQTPGTDTEHFPPLSTINMRISLIAAVAQNGTIGKDNSMPWHLPADLKHFKKTTLGHHIIMGRHTWESIGRALPGRTSVVITRKTGYQAKGCTVCHSLKDALEVARQSGENEAFIAGGANLYEQCLPVAERFYLTEILTDIRGDTNFPEYDKTDWVVVESSTHEADERNPYACRFLVMDKKK